MRKTRATNQTVRDNRALRAQTHDAGSYTEQRGASNTVVPNFALHALCVQTSSCRVGCIILTNRKPPQSHTFFFTFPFSFPFSAPLLTPFSFNFSSIFSFALSFAPVPLCFFRFLSFATTRLFTCSNQSLSSPENEMHLYSSKALSGVHNILEDDTLVYALGCQKVGAETQRWRPATGTLRHLVKKTVKNGKQFSFLDWFG